MKRIGPYRIDGKLGSGAMGLVYRAYDQALDRPVALKILGETISATAWERQRREARLTASVRHPNVVGVHGAGRTPDGRAYLVLDLVDGGSLDERIKRDGKLAPRKAAQLARDLADALHAAHAQGVLHRDVKPHNVLLDAKGRALLADFGLARSRHSEGGVTVEGEIIGSPAYMSPEQARAEHELIAPTTDVYGLGATLYAMLSGKAPHQGETAAEAIKSILQAQPRRLSEVAPGVDAALEAICQRCLEPDPGKRFSTAASLRNALDDYLYGPRSGESWETLSDTAPGADRPWALAAGGVVLGLVLGLVPWLFGGDVAGLEGQLADQQRRALERATRGDHSGASADYDALLKARPDLARLWFERAGQLLALDDTAGALEDLKQLDGVSLDDPWAVPFVRGRVYTRLKDWVAAEDQFSEALELRPTYAIALLQRGLAREERLDLEGAVADYTLALEQDPRLVQALYRRAVVAYTAENYGAARSDLDSALEIDPDFASARVLRARIRVEEEPAAALADCERVVRENAADAYEALVTRARALAKLDRWQEAYSSAEMAVWSKGDAADGYMVRAVVSKGLGMIAERNNRIDDAIRLYRQSLSDAQRYVELGPGEPTDERSFAELRTWVEDRLIELRRR